ncbi:MAG: transcriptional regulator [Gammaproteobacteria bacterium]|nr:MAG: transcriptional regulator [Gammaproteobacteria bacterium]RKZ42517.1 MAG: transcriptional regulator [Gammaproteobacteria bacterium]RKZ71001.1 MAG: transcriptional regulator [Gammaproteobacteria bacterium]
MSQVALQKVGSSFITTIPINVVQTLHLQEGQKFDVSYEAGKVILTPVTTELEEIMQAHNKVLQKYRPAFQQLAES